MKKPKTPKFGLQDFLEKFPNDEACLKHIYNIRYGHLKACPKCNKQGAKFHPYKDRKAFSCQNCGFDIYPLANTIFHKSSTSLQKWYLAIYLFSVSKNGVAAKELERELKVTYKTAWRIAKQIRTLFKENNIKFFGTVEADETYIGGRKRGGPKGRGTKKTPVVGVVQRKGKLHAEAVQTVDRKTLMDIIKKQVKQGTKLMTDEWPAYSKANQLYKHDVIKHGIKEYVRGDVHTNTIEGFWSQLKRSLNGTYHVVSRKYLQSYIDEFAYRYNRRNSQVHLFHLMLERALRPIE
jgi:transposase-like protein